MHWYGFIWHEASKPQLARAGQPIVEALRALDPPLEVHRFAQGSGFGDPEPVLSTDYSEGALLEVLDADECYGFYAGGTVKRPRFETWAPVRSWESRRYGWHRYDPFYRTPRANRLGGMAFRYDPPGGSPALRRDAFVAVMAKLPEVVHARYGSGAFRRHMGSLEPTGKPPWPVEEDVYYRLESLQYFGREHSERLRLRERLLGKDLGLAKATPLQDGVLLEVCPPGGFDARNPAHTDAVRRVLDALPELHPERPPRPPKSPEQPLEVQAATARAMLGRRIESAEYLQYLCRGARIEPGQGPVELRLSGGLTVHSWPFGNSTALQHGPMPDRDIAWPHPAGGDERLVLEPLEGLAPGRTIVAIHVAIWMDYWSPAAWELSLEGGGVLHLANLVWPQAWIGVDGPRPTLHESLGPLEWVELG